VNWCVPGSPADVDGKISSGDEILKVDGIVVNGAFSAQCISQASLYSPKHSRKLVGKYLNDCTLMIYAKNNHIDSHLEIKISLEASRNPCHDAVNMRGSMLYCGCIHIYTYMYVYV
jgi:hypothetical protein